VPGTTDIELHWVETLSDANDFMHWLGQRRTWLAVDTETGGFDWWRDRLRTVQFGDRHHGWCIEWDRWAGLIIEALNRYDGPIAMHNAKFDTHFLEVNGVRLKRWLVHDTRAMAHILNPAKRTGLKPKSAEVLGPWALHGEDELKQAMTAGGWTWDTVPVELLWKYAAFDTVLTAQLADELYPWIAQGYQGIYDLEIASTQVLCDMERRGILIDRGYLTRAMEDWGRQEAAVGHVLKEQFNVHNPNSDQQVMRALERETGWRPIVFTDKGNPKLDDDILRAIDHPVAQLTLGHREYHKMTHTYGRNILELCGPDGRLHASINPLGARTGRMSVSRPSLQNLPAKDDRIRNAFWVPEGYYMGKADYDQIEGRLFAHYSGDQRMLEMVRYGDHLASQGRSGYDLWSNSARMVFGVGWEDEVPKPLRKKVKGVALGKMYGSGLETFAATSGLTLAEASEANSAYERAFPETRKDAFPSRVAKQLWVRNQESGDPHVVTAYGRKEPCWPREAYKAVNYLIQGTAADVLKAKLVELSRTWVGETMILPIHDEVLFEWPEDAAHDALAVVNEVMPERTKFQVPLTTDAELVRRWGDGYGEAA